MLLKIKKFAAFADINPQTVYRLVARGDLPHIRLGRAIRIDTDVLAKRNHGVGAVAHVHA